jgi:hypothetical protein
MTPIRLVTVIVSALISLATSLSVSAGSGNGKVVHLMVHTGDVVLFGLDGPHNDKPACSGDQWALSLATPTGRAQYALLLSAHAQQKVVHVAGAGDCGAWGDRERPFYIWVTG